MSFRIALTVTREQALSSIMKALYQAPNSKLADVLLELYGHVPYSYDVNSDHHYGNDDYVLHNISNLGQDIKEK